MAMAIGASQWYWDDFVGQKYFYDVIFANIILSEISLFFH